MNKEETVKILRHLSLSLQNFDYRADGKIETWHNIFKDYEFNEVFKKVNELLEEDKFQYQPPTPQFIVRNLRKKTEKIKLNAYKIFCRNCGKLCNSYEAEEKHFEKCMSVDYVIRETKKWYGRKLSRRELFEMDEEEFSFRYNKLLEYIYKNTTDEKERMVISHLVN